MRHAQPTIRIKRNGRYVVYFNGRKVCETIDSRGAKAFIEGWNEAKAARQVDILNRIERL